MRRWRWVREDVVYAIHDRQLYEHGGAPGVADAGRLQAALARPQNVAVYGQPDAAELAATYIHALTRNHPFIDGNKRTAWVTARVFLAINNKQLRFHPGDAVRIVEAAAAGEIDEPALAEWFRQRIVSSRKR